MSFIKGLKLITNSPMKIVLLFIWAILFFFTPFVDITAYRLLIIIVVGFYLLFAVVYSISPNITKKPLIIITISPIGWIIVFIGYLGIAILGYLWYIYEAIIFIAVTAPVVKFFPPKSGNSSLIKVLFLNFIWSIISIILAYIYSKILPGIAIPQNLTTSIQLLIVGMVVVFISSYLFILFIGFSKKENMKFIREKIPILQLITTVIVFYWVYRYANLNITTSSLNKISDIAFSLLAIILAIRGMISKIDYNEEGIKETGLKRFIPHFPLDPYATILWIYAMSLATRLYDSSQIKYTQSIFAIIFVPLGMISLLNKISKQIVE